MQSYEWIGWVATALFVSSYFLNEKVLRLTQSTAAGMWIFYGVTIDSFPVIVANGLILVVAMFSVLRTSREVKQA